MPNTVRYLTHPQVNVDPNVPVPLWGLSAIGKARAEMLSRKKWLSTTTQIISSGETKARETAEIIASRWNVTVEVRNAMHENDRSATGYLTPNEFESVADEFFGNPYRSIRGWERAIDAQARIVREVELVLERSRGDGDVLFIGHGAVGTLLYCYYSRSKIDRAQDQQKGGGCCFAFTEEDRQVLHAWKRLEDL